MAPAAINQKCKTKKRNREKENQKIQTVNHFFPVTSSNEARNNSLQQSGACIIIPSLQKTVTYAYNKMYTFMKQIFAWVQILDQVIKHRTDHSRPRQFTPNVKNPTSPNTCETPLDDAVQGSSRCLDNVLRGYMGKKKITK